MLRIDQYVYVPTRKYVILSSFFRYVPAHSAYLTDNDVSCSNLTSEWKNIDVVKYVQPVFHFVYEAGEVATGHTPLLSSLFVFPCFLFFFFFSICNLGH